MFGLIKSVSLSTYFQDFSDNQTQDSSSLQFNSFISVIVHDL
jgi:hypothetical protein